MKIEKKYAMLQIDADIHKMLKEYCKKNGFIMSALVANLIKKQVKSSQRQ